MQNCTPAYCHSILYYIGNKKFCLLKFVHVHILTKISVCFKFYFHLVPVDWFPSDHGDVMFFSIGMSVMLFNVAQC